MGDETQLLIYGLGGFARELAWLIEQGGTDCGRPKPHLVGFVTDLDHKVGGCLLDLPILSLNSAKAQFPRATVVGGIAEPAGREAAMLRAFSLGFRTVKIIHPRVEISPRVRIGDGTVICAGVSITTDIEIGRHVQINPGSTVGHDVIIGDFTTLAPGSRISGRVHLGKRVYIGAGAVVRDGTEERPIVIADDAVVGASACVLQDVPMRTTVIGVPARPMVRKNSV
jgi:sugar O-acyltransferase (sialic acid O-acetyltransferase NeuD family)